MGADRLNLSRAVRVAYVTCREWNPESTSGICRIWKNRFADAVIDYATCVDKQGKRYNIELDNIRGFEDDFEK